MASLNNVHHGHTAKMEIALTKKWKKQVEISLINNGDGSRFAPKTYRSVNDTVRDYTIYVNVAGDKGGTISICKIDFTFFAANLRSMRYNSDIDIMWGGDENMAEQALRALVAALK